MKSSVRDQDPNGTGRNLEQERPAQVRQGGTCLRSALKKRQRQENSFKNTDTPEGGWVRRKTAQVLRDTPDPHTDAVAQVESGVVYRSRDL